MALAMPAGAEDYQLACLIAGAAETQMAAVVTSGSPEEAVTAGEPFTLPDLYVEVDPSIEAEFQDGTLSLLGQDVALGAASQEGPDKLFWGPQDIELTAPAEPGVYDIAPETFSLTWVTPAAPLPISCEFPPGAPIATVDVVEDQEPPPTTPPTTPGTPTTQPPPPATTPSPRWPHPPTPSSANRTSPADPAHRLPLLRWTLSQYHASTPRSQPPRQRAPRPPPGLALIRHTASRLAPVACAV